MVRDFVTFYLERRKLAQNKIPIDTCSRAFIAQLSLIARNTFQCPHLGVNDFLKLRLHFRAADFLETPEVLANLNGLLCGGVDGFSVALKGRKSVYRKWICDLLSIYFSCRWQMWSPISVDDAAKAPKISATPSTLIIFNGLWFDKLSRQQTCFSLSYLCSVVTHHVRRLSNHQIASSALSINAPKLTV